MRKPRKNAVPFTSEPVCSKCGSDEVKLSYEEDCGFFGLGSWETLFVDCQKCGAYFEMMTKEQSRNMANKKYYG